MKKISLMVVAALLSAGMFANSSNLPQNETHAKTTKVRTESKHKQKPEEKKKEKTKDNGKNKKSAKHDKSTK